MPDITESDPRVLWEALHVLGRYCDSLQQREMCRSMSCDDCVERRVTDAIEIARTRVQPEPAPINVQEIVERHLKEIGADGMVHHKRMCICSINHGLFACSPNWCIKYVLDCRPAWFRDGKWTTEKPED